MNLRRILSQAALVTGALLFSVGLQAFAFTQPSASPPNADAYAPLTTSPTGQIKSGNLQVNALGIQGTANALLVPNGQVGIGTTNPGSWKLNVQSGSNTYSGNFSSNVRIGGILTVMGAGGISSAGDVCTEVGGGTCLSTVPTGITGYEIQKTTTIIPPMVAGSSGDTPLYNYDGNLTASCSSGKKVLGGACSINVSIYSEVTTPGVPNSSTGWNCSVSFESSTLYNYTLAAYAICANAQ